MLTFAITTTTKLASVSLSEKDRIIGEIKIEVLRTHSTTILEQIDKLLQWTGKRLDEVENVAVSIGPGSFTGVRIAVSVVKGLFYGRKINFYSVNELDALAYQGYLSIRSCTEASGKDFEENENHAGKTKTIYSLTDSGKEKIYYSKYRITNDGLRQTEGYKVGRLDELMENILLSYTGDEEIYFSGDAVLKYKSRIEDRLKSKVILIAEDYLKISSAVFIRMLFEGQLKKADIYSLKPYYLEKTQAERDKR